MAGGQRDGNTRNQKLIDARNRLDLSTRQVAEAMNAYLWQDYLNKKSIWQARLKQVTAGPKTRVPTTPTVLDHRYISTYEAGRSRWPSQHYREAWRFVLEVASDAELGFYPDRRRRTGIPEVQASTGGLDIRHGVSDTQSVRRRTLVALLASLAAEQTIDRAGLAQLVSGSDLFEAGMPLADHWISVATEHGQAYLTRPRQQTARDLAIDLATLELAFPRAASGAARKSLHEAAARISALLAMACTDLGYSPEARHAWLMARQMSDTSDNRNIQLWVRGQEALLGIYSGRPLYALEQLTTSSLLSADESNKSGKADLLAAQAEIFALQGREQDALGALEELNRTFDHLPGSVSTDINSIYGWPEHRLRHTESFVHSVVGSTENATPSHLRALELYPASRPVSRCQIEMHRAVSAVRDGEVSDGINHAVSELERLAPGRRGRFVLAVAGLVQSAIPPSESIKPQARDFHAYLSDLETSTV